MFSFKRTIKFNLCELAEYYVVLNTNKLKKKLFNTKIWRKLKKPFEKKVRLLY